MPSTKQACPNNAACWSPAIPATGMPSGTPQRSDVSPNLPLEADTLGSAASGTPRSAHSSSLHRSSVMSKSIVREAFDGSVACTSPPVRFHRIHASIVPSASWSVAGTPPAVNSHSNLVPEK
jgi:hypothetical protein